MRRLLVAARVGRDRAVDTWSTESLEVVDEFQSTVGDGVAVNVIFEHAWYTRDRFAELLANIFLGALWTGNYELTGSRTRQLLGSAATVRRLRRRPPDNSI